MVPQRHPIPPTPRTTPIKHLSEFNMWAHREQGLCYTCDEKFTQGHQCAEKNPYILDVASPMHMKFVKLLKIQQMIRLNFNSLLLTLLLMTTTQRYHSMH